MQNRKLSYKIAKEIVESLPGFEHTKILTSDEIISSKDYYTYRFGDEPKDKPLGNIIQTKRDEKGNLMITTTKRLTHSLVSSSTGMGKTQGIILPKAFNADNRMSYIFMDVKGEILKYSYTRLVEIFGPENVVIANFINPFHSQVKFNFFTPLAYRWIESSNKKNKEETRDYIVSELRKICDMLYKSISLKDPTWENVARTFLLAVIIALFEDLTISESETKKTGRSKTTPEMINFRTISKIVHSFSFENRFIDNGFFTKRKKTSRAYSLAKPVIYNAPNTRQNYMAFILDFANQYSDDKICKISEYNSFDFLTLTTTPKVVLMVFDMTDNLVREYVNMVVTRAISELRDYCVKTGNPLKIPVSFVCDEFASLKPNTIFTDILATGRGFNIYMDIVIQSYSQLKSAYPEKYQIIKQNCDLEFFLGTNCVETASEFARNLGLTTEPDSMAFLNGRISPSTHPVVTEDYLLHKIVPQEAYVKVNRSEPLHSNFEFYYCTPEYTQYPQTDLNQFCPKSEMDFVNNNYILPKPTNMNELDDDDDFF